MDHVKIEYERASQSNPDAFAQGQPISPCSHCGTLRQIPALLLVVWLVVGYFFPGLIVTGQAFAKTNQNVRAYAAKAKEAKKLYKQQCVKCHGADGTGNTTEGQILGATDFIDSDWQERVEDQRLQNSITYGRGQMPPFGKKLTQQQIRILVAYVRAFKKE